MSLKCYCNENTFTYNKTTIGTSSYQIVKIDKCNRSQEDSIFYNHKKKPCLFNNSEILKEFEKIADYTTFNKHPIIKTIECDIKHDNRKSLMDHLKRYDLKCSNYFGNLNIHLKNLGYEPHLSDIETLSELKRRISRPPIKKKDKIYYSGAQKYYCLGTIYSNEFHKPEENIDPTHLVKPKDYFSWTLDADVQAILNRKKKKNIKKKTIKKKKTVNKYVDINELLDKNETENEKETEEQKEQNEKENSDKGSDDEGSDDEKSEKGFDMDDNVGSDNEDDMDNDYNEFSD